MKMDLCSRLSLEWPIVQAGMAGLARAELAQAVSRAGGLGTVGLLEPPAFRAELRRARALAEGRPIAANLLLPFTKRAHVEACILERVPVVTLFFGFDARIVQALREAGAFVFHQVGSGNEARHAVQDGADGLIAQGFEAGGHLRATDALDSVFRSVLAEAAGRPVLAAGGVVDAASAARWRALGAAGVSVGTRFLLTPESAAHPAYKARLLEARETLVTLLFGAGWPAWHRVAPNAATRRWCAHRSEGPALVRALNRATAPLLSRVPLSRRSEIVKRQTLAVPVYSPTPLEAGMHERYADVTPLYAGAGVGSVTKLVSAAEVVKELAGSFGA